MTDLLWRSLAIGIGATALMDAWAIFLNRAFGNPLPNWALTGRWFCHMTDGRLFHDDIAAAVPWPNELAVGWIAHYAIGILYAGILLVAAGPEWAAAPSFLPAWILGLVTVGAGWFLMQPGMGAGWAASKKPNPMQIRFLNIVAHTVFAAGLYGTARLIALTTDVAVDPEIRRPLPGCAQSKKAQSNPRNLARGPSGWLLSFQIISSYRCVLG